MKNSLDQLAYDHVCKGIISTDDGCERAQPAMGSTIPRQLGLSYESRKPNAQERTGCQVEFLHVSASVPTWIPVPGSLSDKLWPGSVNQTGPFQPKLLLVSVLLEQQKSQLEQCSYTWRRFWRGHSRQIQPFLESPQPTQGFILLYELQSCLWLQWVKCIKLPNRAANWNVNASM